MPYLYVSQVIKKYLYHNSASEGSQGFLYLSYESTNNKQLKYHDIITDYDVLFFLLFK